MVGLGRIGRTIARRALGFNMRLLYSNASTKPELEAEWGLQHRTFEQLLAESDFVCLTVPLTEQTDHLLGYEQCRTMKRSHS